VAVHREGFLMTWACWGVTVALLGGVAILAACGPSFQQIAAAECQGLATATAYAECERRLSQHLANERLDYIVRSQVIDGPRGRLQPLARVPRSPARRSP
jgi:hypothetical protein